MQRTRSGGCAWGNGAAEAAPLLSSHSERFPRRGELMKKALFRGVRGIPGLIVLGLMATTLVLTVLNPGVFVALLSETVIVQRALAESYVKFPVPPPSSITQIVPPVTKRRSPALEVPALAMPQITPGINVRVNSNPGTLTRPQVEPSVASNPTDPRQLAAGFADYLSNPPLNDAAPGVARSTDGGQTWFVPILFGSIFAGGRYIRGFLDFLPS